MHASFACRWLRLWLSIGSAPDVDVRSTVLLCVQARFRGRHGRVYAGRWVTRYGAERGDPKRWRVSRGLL